MMTMMRFFNNSHELIDDFTSPSIFNCDSKLPKRKIHDTRFEDRTDLAEHRSEFRESDEEAG